MQSWILIVIRRENEVSSVAAELWSKRGAEMTPSTNANPESINSSSTTVL